MTMQCDHTIAVTHGYEGSTLYKQSEVGEFSTADEIFRFCPQCGEPISLTPEQLDAAYQEAHLPFVGPLTQSQTTCQQAMKLLTDKLFKERQTDFKFYSGDQWSAEELAQRATSTIKIRLPNRYTTKEPT